jgi:hypothetical protein
MVRIKKILNEPLELLVILLRLVLFSVPLLLFWLGHFRFVAFGFVFHCITPNSAYRFQDAGPRWH